MSNGTDGLKAERVVFLPQVLVAGVSPEIDLKGGTLLGVLLEGDVTSTAFSISVARKAGGTYVTNKDSQNAGIDVTYTLADTATGYYSIPPAITAGMRFCKINFNQSEAPTIYAAIRSIE